jgi:hypothetical protein
MEIVHEWNRCQDDLINNESVLMQENGLDKGDERFLKDYSQLVLTFLHMEKIMYEEV